MTPRPLIVDGTVHINYEEVLFRKDGEMLTSGMHAGPVTFFFTRWSMTTALTQKELTFIHDKLLSNTESFKGRPITSGIEEVMLAVIRDVFAQAQQYFDFEVSEEPAYVEEST